MLLEYKKDQFPKEHACGCSYNAADWRRLPWVGIQYLHPGALELRTCTCGSSIGVLTELAEPVIFEDRAYWPKQAPMLTGRAFPGWWGEARDGELYISEWSAAAIDAKGAEVILVWRWTERRGEEHVPRNRDWSEPVSVEHIQ